MNHSGIGRIDENGSIFLPADIMSPLSISNDSRVWGMYYPCSYDIDSRSEKKVKYDFMISPLPFDHWGKVVRIKIRLKPVKEALKEITKEIMDKNGSILLSEFSRSAHHYDTATFIITFDDLSDEEIFDDESSALQTKKRADELIEQLMLKCNDLIFREKCDQVSHEIIRVSSYQAMAYFYKIAKNKSYRNCDCKNEFGAFEIFTLKYSAEGYLVPEDNKFKEILDDIQDKDKLTVKPCNFFCELDTNDINIRMVLIPLEKEKNFFYLKASNLSSNDNKSSKGLMNHFASSFPDSYVIWRIANSPKRSGDGYDEAVTEFFIEDTYIKTRIDRQKELRNQIESNMPKSLSHIKSINIDVVPLRTGLRKERFNKIRDKEDYDVFISFSAKDKELAESIHEKIEKENFKCYLSEKNIKAGDKFPDEIRDALRGSNELVLLISQSSLKSNWVIRECGAAWVLGIKIVPIVFDITIDKLPSWLNHIHAYSYANLDKYISELHDRNTLS